MTVKEYTIFFLKMTEKTTVFRVFSSRFIILRLNTPSPHVTIILTRQTQSLLGHISFLWGRRYSFRRLFQFTFTPGSTASGIF